MLRFKGYRKGETVICHYSPNNHTFLINGKPIDFPIKQNSDDGLFVRLIMGTQCNMKCSYCSQLKSDISYSISDCDKWEKPEGLKSIEFWGGEPLLYRKYIERLLPKLKDVKKGIITNGSLLTDEVVDWLNSNEIRVTISHDSYMDTRDYLELNPQVLNRISDLYVNTIITPDIDPFKVADYFENLGIKAKLRFHPCIYNTSNYHSTPEKELELASRLFTLAQTNRIDGLVWDSMHAMHGILGVNPSCSLYKSNIRVFDIKGNEFLCQNYVSRKDIITNGEKKLQNFDVCKSCCLQNICGGGCRVVKSRQFYDTCRSYFVYWLAMFQSAVFKHTNVILQMCDFMPVPYWSLDHTQMIYIRNYQMPFLIEDLL